MLISNAFAQAAGAAPQTDTLLTFLPMVAIFVVFYFLLIRPQQKKAKEARSMLEALEKGNEVVTATIVDGDGVFAGAHGSARFIGTTDPSGANPATGTYRLVVNLASA